jgi:RNA polymerase sigma factor (sigma-70 family)
MAHGSLHAVLHYVRRVISREGEADQGDAQLLRRFTAHGDEAAFASLVQRHGPMVWGVCTRVLSHTQDAEDAFQATFLILVRKARSLLRPDSLGPWLYGVAQRTAAKARTVAARRQARETPVVEHPSTEPTPDLLWRDLRPILDEEVNRLPAHYRDAFLLCYLEGLTNEEAALRLGCPKGTVLSRLSRARELLRARLTRRGVGLSGAALAALLAENFSSAAPPPALLESTVHLGLSVAAGVAAPALSAQAAVLAEGVLHGMFVTKMKFVAVIVLLLGVAAGSGVGLLARGPGEEKTEAAKKGTPAVEKKVAVLAPAAPGKVVEEDGARVIREKAGKKAKFAGVDDPKVTLKEVLDILAKTYDVHFEVNERAFKECGLNDVLNTTVCPPAIRARDNVTLSVVLRDVLSRVTLDPGAAGGAAPAVGLAPVVVDTANIRAVYLIRSEEIEITTSVAVREELGVEYGRPLRVVWEDFENVPFSTAMKTLAISSGVNVILDPRAVDETVAKAPVNARFANVQVDTAVRVLANMLDLQMVQMDNVLYVTTPKRAGLLLEEQKAKRAATYGALGAQGAAMQNLGGVGLPAIGAALPNADKPAPPPEKDKDKDGKEKEKDKEQ